MRAMTLLDRTFFAMCCMNGNSPLAGFGKAGPVTVKSAGAWPIHS